MVSPVCDGYHQEVVKGRSHPGRCRSQVAGRLSCERTDLTPTLTTPLPPSYLAEEKRSVLLSIAEMGCIELVAVVRHQNVFPLANRRGTFEVVDG